MDKKEVRAFLSKNDWVECRADGIQFLKATCFILNMGKVWITE